MAWNDKYWDIISNLYWTPRYLGLRSIGRDKWRVDGDWVALPKELVTNNSGPLYIRARKFAELKTYLEGQEEILNHLFNLVFSVAGDEVLARLLCKPLRLSDTGPFLSLGREIAKRYGWRDGENVTQQDGLFVSSSSIIGVELKLGSSSWPEQIAKYVALMIWEEGHDRSREHLGLLFVVPEQALSTHWSNVGLEGPAIDPKFTKQLDPARLPNKIRKLFDERPDEVSSVLARLRLAVISWREFCVAIAAIESGLDRTRAGDQTLQRLLEGFRNQIERQLKTGLNHPKEGELVTVIDGKATDRNLHKEVLDGGDRAGGEASKREEAAAAGLTEQELQTLYGPPAPNVRIERQFASFQKDVQCPRQATPWH